MRLSDRQYKLCTRVGFALTILAALAYDYVPTGFQLAVLAVAIIGAIIGFSPLATSHPFRSNDEEDQILGESLVEHAHEVLDQGSVHLYPLDDQKFSDVPRSPNRDLDVYLRHLYSVIDRHIYSNMDNILGRRGGCMAAYDPDTVDFYLRSYVFSGVDIQRERSERVYEVHELVHKLKGIPQEFSVELTNSNSIIVRCERPKESGRLLMEMQKDWDFGTEDTESTQHETIN